MESSVGEGWPVKQVIDSIKITHTHQKRTLKFSPPPHFVPSLSSAPLSLPLPSLRSFLPKFRSSSSRSSSFVSFRHIYPPLIFSPSQLATHMSRVSPNPSFAREASREVTSAKCPTVALFAQSRCDPVYNTPLRGSTPHLYTTSHHSSSLVPNKGSLSASSATLQAAGPSTRYSVEKALAIDKEIMTIQTS